MSLIEREDKTLMDNIFTKALNKRLNVTGKNITEIAAIAAD